MRSLYSRPRAESGQVLVFFALLIPVVFAIGAIVIDVGNWYVHKRHLQTPVDAGALASGPEFVGCFLDPVNANLAIASRALAYSGDTLRPGRTESERTAFHDNLQVQRPNDVRVALNATRYWDKPDSIVGVNGYNNLDNKLDSADADLLGDPCNEAYLDVKATDDEAPPIWGLLPLSQPRSRMPRSRFVTSKPRGACCLGSTEIDPAAVATALHQRESDRRATGRLRLPDARPQR